MTVQGGEQHHRPLHDEARRRLERVRVATRAELDAAVTAGDGDAARRAALQLEALERALAAHDGNGPGNGGPSRPAGSSTRTTGGTAEHDAGRRRDRAVDA